MPGGKTDDINEMEEEYNSDDSSSSDEEDDGVDPEAYNGNEEVLIDFEGRAPVDPDFHGISQLLSRLFLKAHIDRNEMAKMIIGQNYVGSVIAQCEADAPSDSEDDNMCEDGTIFGITSVLNITDKKEVPCIQQLRAYILERAQKNATDAVLKHFREVLDNEERPVGFLINERFINIPSQISVPMLESLCKEMKEATQKGMKFDFIYLLMIVKFWRKTRKNKPDVINFTNAEEEVICEKAVSSFEFTVLDESDTGMAGNWTESDIVLKPFRKVLLFDAKQLPQIVDDIKNFISGA